MPNVSSDRSDQFDEQRVVRLHPRRGGAARGRPSHGGRAPELRDYAKYEGGDRQDDYGHRMRVNLAALIFTALLASAGAWLAINIAEMRKNQDCVLFGRNNCNPIDVSVAKR